jgi:hypothetical protein
VTNGGSALASSWKFRGGLGGMDETAVVGLVRNFATFVGGTWSDTQATKSWPAFWRGSFASPLKDGMFATVGLRTSGLSSGSAWLNGHNLGRFSGNTLLYVPEGWIGATNTLVIYDASGNSPTGVKLEYIETRARSGGTPVTPGGTGGATGAGGASGTGGATGAAGATGRGGTSGGTGGARGAGGASGTGGRSAGGTAGASGVAAGGVAAGGNAVGGSAGAGGSSAPGAGGAGPGEGGGSGGSAPGSGGIASQGGAAGGTDTTGSSSGCSCALGGRSERSAGWAWLALTGLLLVFRRSRKRSQRG